MLFCAVQFPQGSLSLFKLRKSVSARCLIEVLVFKTNCSMLLEMLMLEKITGAMHLASRQKMLTDTRAVYGGRVTILRC